MTKVSELLNRLDERTKAIQKTLNDHLAEQKDQEKRIRRLEWFAAVATGAVLILEFIVKH